MMAKFSVFGDPQGKARPKFSNVHGHAIARTPKKTVEYENLIRTEYWLQCKNLRFADDAPVGIIVKAYYSIPKSVSKQVRAAMIAGDIMPTKKPDADNVLKVVADSLNQVAYKDDAQIVSATFHKYYSEAPRLEVSIHNTPAGYAISQIDRLTAKQIVDTRKPRGLFYTNDETVVIGIDNSTGNAWIEEFKNLNSCKKWLRGGDLNDTK